MNHISSKIMSRNVMFEAKKTLFPNCNGKTSLKNFKNNPPPRAKQLMAGAPEEKKSPPAPYPKKH